MTDCDERRVVERMQRSEAAKVRILSCADPALVERNIIGQTIDISPNGIQLSFMECLPIESEIEICIKLHGMPSTFYLKGKVCFCQAMDDGKRHLHGISIDDTPTADILSWKELFNE